MLGPIVSSRGRKERLRRLAPSAAVLLVALLAGLSLGSSYLVTQHLRDEALTASRIYSTVYGALNNPNGSDETSALLELGERIGELGIPLVVTDTSGRVTLSNNLPFVPTGNPTGRDDPRVAAYAQRLDGINPAIVVPGFAVIHYGPVPITRLMLTLGGLQVLTMLVMVTVGISAYRTATTAQRDRMWVAMAREAAHQMGTPLTSLQGWIEQLRTEGLSREEIAEFLDSDAERLQRVAQRFERIGNPAQRDPIGGDVHAGGIAHQAAAVAAVDVETLDGDVGGADAHDAALARADKARPVVADEAQRPVDDEIARVDARGDGDDAAGRGGVNPRLKGRRSGW